MSLRSIIAGLITGTKSKPSKPKEKKSVDSTIGSTDISKEVITYLPADSIDVTIETTGTTAISRILGYHNLSDIKYAIYAATKSGKAMVYSFDKITKGSHLLGYLSQEDREIANLPGFAEVMMEHR